ncbi:MAG: hypothetical protein Q4F81_08775 [Eubacteriales bacterium]|nr:hypothetical protein [Eubacteriales bacterium]
MMRKRVSRLLALVLVLGMVMLCLPGQVRAEGMADVVIPSDASVPSQSVAVEPPVDEDAGSACSVEAKITEVEKNNGGITQIEYEISINNAALEDGDGREISGGTVSGTDAAAMEGDTPAPQYRVEMTVNGMTNTPTRVAYRKMSDAAADGKAGDPEDEVVYYYDAANGTEDAGRKYFTVTEVEADTGETDEDGHAQKVISLWCGSSGVFQITSDAFEGADGSTYATLTEAARNNAGKTVELLRDYETDAPAVISNDVTVDLNGHEYINTGISTAINVTGSNVAIQNGSIISGGTGVEVGSTSKTLSLETISLRSNADGTTVSDIAGLKVTASGNTVNVSGSTIDGSNSRWGIQYTGDTVTRSTLNIKDSDVMGGTGVEIENANASITGSYLAGTGEAAKDSASGAALAVADNGVVNSVVINSGLFDSVSSVENIYATGSTAVGSINVNGGRFSDPDDLSRYISRNHALICHNDGSHFLYEVVGVDDTPTRDSCRFLGYTDAKGSAITLAEAYRKGVVAYAQWKEIPEITAAETPQATESPQDAEPAQATESPVVAADTGEVGFTVKGDTAYITERNAESASAPIREVTLPSVKQLQDQDIDTVEIQVDEDVTLVLDIEKAGKNGFTDTIEVTLNRDTLLITSGAETCIELDIAELKACGSPVEIQLVEGDLTVTLGKSSSLTVDLTDALETGERIVVKLENDALKLYDKYNRTLEED